MSRASSLSPTLSAFALNPGQESSIPRLSIALLCLALLSIGWNGWQVAGQQWHDWWLLLAAASLLTSCVLNRRWSLCRWGGIWLPLAVALTLGGELSLILLGRESSTGMVVAGKYVFTMLSVPYLIAWACNLAPQAARLMLACWFFGAAFNAIAAIGDHHGLSQFGSLVSDYSYAAYRRVWGLSSHPNSLAAALVSAWPVALVFMSQARRTWFRVFAMGIVFAMAYAVLLSASRTGLLGLAVAGLMMTPHLMRFSSLRVLLERILALLVISIFLAWSGWAPWMDDLLIFDRLFNNQLTFGSDHFRLRELRQAWEVFSAAPIFGQGYGDAMRAHNIYAQLLAAGGLMGILGLVSLALFPFASLRLASQSGESGLWMRAMHASICAWLVMGMFQNSIYDRFIFVPIGFMLALANAAQARGAKGSAA